MWRLRGGNLLAVVMILVYAVLIGAGAFLQYDASMALREVLDGKTGAEISPEDKESLALMDKHTQQSKLSGVLKAAGRRFLLASTVLMSIILFAKKITLKQYAFAVIGSMIAGLIATMPWWLASGIGAMNYYQEQVVFCGISAMVVIATLVVERVLCKKRML